MEEDTSQRIIKFANKPKPIANKSTYCYGIAILQLIFSLKDFQNFVNQLTISDPLYKIALEYSKSEVSCIDYNIFSKNSNQIMKHKGSDDAYLYFDTLLKKYPDLCSLFSFNATIMEGLSEQQETITSIFLNPIESIQKSLDLHMESGNIFNVTSSPQYLAIKIYRFIGTGNELTFDLTPVHINKWINFNNGKYQFKGCVYHSGIKVTSGHYIAISRYGDTLYYLNDDKVDTQLPANQPFGKVEQRVVLLIYQLENDATLFDSTPISMQFNKVLKNEKKEKLVKHSSDSKELYEETPNVSNLKTIPQEIHFQTIESYHEEEHRSCQINLHDEFLYLDGTLDVDDTNAPGFDYKSVPRMFQRKADIIAMFTSVLSSIKFNYKLNNGDTNASLLHEALNISAYIATDEQILSAIELVKPIFYKYMETEKLPDKKKLETELYDALHLKLEETALDDSDTPNYSILTTEEEDQYVELGEKYDYKQRVDDMQIGAILEHIMHILQKENKGSETEYQIKANSLKNALYEGYKREKLLNPNISPRAYAEEWANKRNDSKAPEEIAYSANYTYRLLLAFDENESIIPTKSRGGNNTVLNDEIIKCVIATVLDFPEATDRQRTEFINKHGPCKNTDPISQSTINRILNKLKFTSKQPCFSPMQRNCIGYRIARSLWADFILGLTRRKDVIITFIDEAGVVLKGTSKARGFTSITPCINKANIKKGLSVLTCIVPGFGTITRYYSKAVNTDHYASFLREIAYIIRSKIITAKIQLVVIHDNAKIHKTKTVYEAAKLSNINLLFTVPYSPQCNILVENFFGRMKFLTIYEKDIDDISQNEKNNMVPITSKSGKYAQHVIRLWNNCIKNHYDGKETLRIYGMWLNILNKCKNGIPLSGDHVSSVAHDGLSLRAFNCYRKYNLEL